MLVQAKPVMSEEIPITGVSPKKFIFNQFFQMGGETTTNISQRGFDFYDSFQENSLHQCEVPDCLKFIDVPPHEKGTLKDFLGSVQSLKEFWGLRVPIKLVGHMKDEQKHGQEGHLLVSGGENIFLCRASDNNLQLVKLKFKPKNPKDSSSNSWTVHSKFFDPDEVISGHMRFFIACR